MKFFNWSDQKIAVGDSLKGELKHKFCVLKPGQELIINGLYPTLVMEFVHTPDGLRVAVHEEGSPIWTPTNDNHPT